MLWGLRESGKTSACKNGILPRTFQRKKKHLSSKMRTKWGPVLELQIVIFIKIVKGLQKSAYLQHYTDHNKSEYVNYGGTFMKFHFPGQACTDAGGHFYISSFNGRWTHFHMGKNETVCVKLGLHEDHFSSLVLMRTKFSIEDLFASTKKQRNSNQGWFEFNSEISNISAPAIFFQLIRVGIMFRHWTEGVNIFLHHPRSSAKIYFISFLLGLRNT